MYTQSFKSAKSIKGFAQLTIIRGDNNLPDYQFISLDEHFAAFTGKKIEELKGKRVSQLFPKDHNFSAIFKFDFPSVALKCAEINEEVYLAGFDKWYSVFAFSTAHKEINLVICDITADKSSNEAIYLKLARNLELESAKLQTIISELPAGVVIGAPSGEILSMNKVGLQLHGFKSEEEMFSRLDKYVEEFELLQSDGTPLPFESWPAAKGIKGDFIQDLEVILYNKKCGTKKYVSYSTAGVKDNQGKITHLIYVIYDLTERKKSEERLEEAFHEKEVLLRELYHRTKNNMQVVCSLLGLKSNSFMNTDVESVFTDMQNRIRAIALVHEKLYQSQNLSRVNLKEYIIDLVHLLFNSHQIKKGIEFRHDLEEINVLIDTAVPIGLILTELILNSIKYAFPADMTGYIEVNLKHMEDHSILIIISDDGIGLKESDMENPDKLGLQLVRTIGENQLNGEVSVDITKGVSWSIRFKDNSYTERV